MANEQIKISELTEVTSVTGNEEMPVVQSGSTKKMSLNQVKDFIGGAGVIIFPEDILELKQDSTSDEIFNAFGGKDAFMDICQSIVNKDTVCVVANIPEESGMKLVYIPVMAMATYTDANNANFMMAIITETTFQLVVTVTDGVATQSSQVLNHIYEAPSDGNVYGRKNKDWVEVPEKSDVLTKTNTSPFTPTQHYHPATKAYVDDIGYGRTITTTVDKFLNTANLSGVDAEQRVIDLFGSLDNFKNVVANILANHVRYYFHFGDNPDNNCVELGCVNAWRANNNSSHELHFIITYYDENNLYTNRISIVVNNDTAASKVIIASLVNSDNVATLTKKTSTEYSNINPKANNTAYLVTDD